MALTCSWKYVFWLLAFLCVLVVLPLYLFPLTELTSYQVKKETNDGSCFIKEGIAKELNEIHVDMQRLLIHKQAPSATLVERLGAIVNRLDNSLPPSKTNTTVSKNGTLAPSATLVQRLGAIVNRLDNSLHVPPNTTNTTVSKNGTLDVCPEVFQGRRPGSYPFYADKGWTTINCTNAKPIRSVISVLVNTVAYPKEDEKHIETVLKGITETYPTVRVHLATRSNEVMEAAKKYNNTDVVKVDDVKVSKGWNTLISKVSTPYVLVARDVFHFTWLTQLERQIRVVSQIPNVAVVGGAYRNLSGHWKAGCVQTTLKNYFLEYEEGYYHSKNECMFCNYVQGPFVTKTNLLKLDESLPNEVVFEDWFLRVVGDGNLIMACPDAMYFTTDYSAYSKRTDKNVWTPLAKKWELNRVLLPQGVKHSFSCQEIGFKCNANHNLLPVCCLEEYAVVMSFLRDFTDKHNISFELDSGSALGGVKFNGLVPWDIDGDIFLSCSGIEIFSKKETIEHFQKNGYRLTEYQQPKRDEKGECYFGFVKIYFKAFNIEVWGMHTMSNAIYLPPELQNTETYTKASIRGNWIDTKYSPGLYSRNRYGREILKHSQSWRKIGLKNSFDEYVAGSFKPCANPNHHSCLQNFLADGNIPFLVT